jgi:serine/threonine protein kinase
MKGSTSTAFKEDGKIIKRQNLFLDKDLIKNEARILKRLKGIHFPALYESTDNEIVIEDCGERLFIHNLPKDWKRQFNEILFDLANCGVIHRDIRPDNLLVKDGVIRLIDFGWARLFQEPDGETPTPLGLNYKPSWGFDDVYSMKKIAREIEYKLEG